jgi:hypothetical protein
LDGAVALGLTNGATDTTTANATGTANIAFASGNPGNNNGTTVNFPGGGGLIVLANPNTATTADASGTFNRAFSVGNGSFAFAMGGDPTNLTSIGNNTALTLGNGSNSFALGTPLFGGPGFGTNNQFAAALGNNKNAVNGINNQ